MCDIDISNSLNSLYIIIKWLMKFELSYVLASSLHDRLSFFTDFGV